MVPLTGIERGARGCTIEKIPELAQIVANELFGEIVTEPHADHTQDESCHKSYVRAEPPSQPAP